MTPTHEPMIALVAGPQVPGLASLMLLVVCITVNFIACALQAGRDDSNGMV